MQCNPNGLRKSIGFGQTGQPVCFGPNGTTYADPWSPDPTQAACQQGWTQAFDQPLGEWICMEQPKHQHAALSTP